LSGKCWPTRSSWRFLWLTLTLGAGPGLLRAQAGLGCWGNHRPRGHRRRDEQQVIARGAELIPTPFRRHSHHGAVRWAHRPNSRRRLCSSCVGSAAAYGGRMRCAGPGGWHGGRLERPRIAAPHADRHGRSHRRRRVCAGVGHDRAQARLVGGRVLGQRNCVAPATRSSPRRSQRWWCPSRRCSPGVTTDLTLLELLRSGPAVGAPHGPPRHPAPMRTAWLWPTLRKRRGEGDWGNGLLARVGCYLPRTIASSPNRILREDNQGRAGNPHDRLTPDAFRGDHSAGT